MLGDPIRAGVCSRAACTLVSDVGRIEAEIGRKEVLEHFPYLIFGTNLINDVVIKTNLPKDLLPSFDKFGTVHLASPGDKVPRVVGLCLNTQVRGQADLKGCAEVAMHGESDILLVFINKWQSGTTICSICRATSHTRRFRISRATTSPWRGRAQFGGAIAGGEAYW